MQIRACFHARRVEEGLEEIAREREKDQADTNKGAERVSTVVISSVTEVLPFKNWISKTF